jgi:hypothetical protein
MQSFIERHADLIVVFILVFGGVLIATGLAAAIYPPTV